MKKTKRILALVLVVLLVSSTVYPKKDRMKMSRRIHPKKLDLHTPLHIHQPRQFDDRIFCHLLRTQFFCPFLLCCQRLSFFQIFFHRKHFRSTLFSVLIHAKAPPSPKFQPYYSIQPPARICLFYFHFFILPKALATKKPETRS